MRLRSILPLLGALSIAAFTAPLRAQADADVRSRLRPPDSSHVQVIQTRDGVTLVGRILSVSDEEIRFQSSIGRSDIPIANIARIREVPASSMHGDGYWPPIPTATRLFVGPTGRTLPSGVGYIADHELIFPSVAYGVTDRVTVGGGVSLIPCGGRDCNQILYFTPKVGVVESENAHLAVGALVLRAVGFEDSGVSSTAGILYGVGTFGSADRSLTLGLGYGFVGSSLADKPAISIGGEFRLARHVSLLSENYALPGLGDPIVSYGVRFFNERFSLDLGWVNVLSGDAIFPGLPLVGFAYHW